MATDSVRVKPASYLGGIPGQERRNSGNGTLHLGPRSLYVGKAVVLGAAVVGVKYGQVDLDKISSIGIRTTTTPDRVAITVHLKDGSAGSYEVKGQSHQQVLELLQPVAAQLGIRIGQEADGAGVLPNSQRRLLPGCCGHWAKGSATCLLHVVHAHPCMSRALCCEHGQGRPAWGPEDAPLKPYRCDVNRDAFSQPPHTTVHASGRGPGRKTSPRREPWRKPGSPGRGSLAPRGGAMALGRTG